MKSESTFRLTSHLCIVLWFGSLSPSLWAQITQPIPLNYVEIFEQKLVNDLNVHLPGIQTIQIETITISQNSKSNSENFYLVANAIRSACSKSVHHYNLNSNSAALPKALLLRAEILPSKGNDIVAFILVHDREGVVLFSENYSLKSKYNSKPLPNILLAVNASAHSNIEFTALANQGMDTITDSYAATCYGFNLTGSQYANARRDFTYGYTIGVLYMEPITSNTTYQPPKVYSLLLGFTADFLIQEFRLFNSPSNLSWSSSLTTDLYRLNYGQGNFSSGIALYVTKNFSLRSGIELCNRHFIPSSVKTLGVSNFDRFYFGMGLGF